MTRRYAVTVGGAVLCLSLHAATATASLLTLTSRNDFAWNATLDWGQLPPCQERLETPFTATSTNGLDVQVTHADQPVALTRQIPPDCGWGGWDGNFAPGDNLIWTGLRLGYDSNPLTLNFSQPIFGFGAQFGYEFIGTLFSAQIDAYNGTQFLGSVLNSAGNATDLADDTAIFLGVIDTSGPNITRVVLSVITPSNDIDFAINQLSLLETPEPASLLLVASGLFAMVRTVRRRRRPQA